MNKLSIESNKPNLIKNQNNWSSNEKKTVPVIKFQSVDGQKQCKFSVYLITQKCKRVARCPNQHESLQNLHVRCFCVLFLCLPYFRFYSWRFACCLYTFFCCYSARFFYRRSHFLFLSIHFFMIIS